MTRVHVTDLVKDYSLRSGLRRTRLRAVDHVSLDLVPGRTVALVGESGSGKSTIAKILTRMERPTSGTVDVRLDDGTPVQGSLYRRQVQMVFQDPFASLNPFHSIEHHVARPLRIHQRTRTAQETHERVLELLERVNLTPAETIAPRRPHELSGGQRQRVAIARALAPGAQVLVADEPVSMLDVSLRAGVLALLEELRAETGVSLLYITHDLLSARVITDRIMVLHHGRVVESGGTAQVLRFPEDEYTTRLLDAIPQPARRFGGVA